MTDDDKALVERLRFYATEAQLGAYYDDDTRQVDQAADRIEALSAENERLRYELRCIFNDYQGYMADEWIASVRAALGETE